MAIQSYMFQILEFKGDWEDVEKDINRLGNDGWDIAAVLPEDEIIIFKRPTDGIARYTGSGIRRKRPERKEPEIQPEKAS